MFHTDIFMFAKILQREKELQKFVSNSWMYSLSDIILMYICEVQTYDFVRAQNMIAE